MFFIWTIYDWDVVFVMCVCMYALCVCYIECLGLLFVCCVCDVCMYVICVMCVWLLGCIVLYVFVELFVNLTFDVCLNVVIWEFMCNCACIVGGDCMFKCICCLDMY